MKSKVAIQGIKGSYHHQVALQYFGETVDVLECMSFGDVAMSLVKATSEHAVMAIENSIAGSIIPNYAYIDECGFSIIGEFYAPIQHCLMALPGQSITDIIEVHSHPMALLQCKEFFKKHTHIKLVEAPDTALVAQQIDKEKSLGIGAVAGAIAATLYHLDMLAQNIQTVNTNSTRFFILNHKSNTQQVREGVNKATLKMMIAHEQGSLATILNIMSNCNLNLTKIQSLPVPNQPWQYSFFMDVTFAKYDDLMNATVVIQDMILELKILGIYKDQKQ
ncbi:prephenate dehydratase [Aquimarina sp. W85]|uniref:prephenate dehydratase n=1 Tax=Aquimarina rhodophyticola TaxID=3342246 RepID=UPI00366B1953